MLDGGQRSHGDEKRYAFIGPASQKLAGATLAGWWTGTATYRRDANWSFDTLTTDMYGQSVPAEWALSTPNGWLGSVHADQSTVHPGGSTASLLFQSIRNVPAATPVLVSVDPIIPIVPGRTYACSAWCQVSTIPGGVTPEALLLLVWLDNTSTEIVQATAALTASTGGAWVQLTCTGANLTAPANAASALIIVAVSNPGTAAAAWSVWFDDVAFG